jgi:uncharacterized membrane protein
MSARTAIALLVLLLLVAPAQALGTAGGDGAGGGGVHGAVDAPSLLYLRAGVFDPLTDPVPGPSFLHSRSTHPYYVVQFDGPVMPTWREDVEALGVVLLGYLPDDAFYAWMPGHLSSDVLEVEHVRYVGPAHPAYRVHPALWADLRTQLTMELEVLTWTGEGSESVARLVGDAGGRVLSHDIAWVTVRAPLAVALALLREPALGVRWVEERYPMEPINDNDARTANARQQSDGSYISDGHALWSYIPSTDSFEGYTGENVTITVADTGVDTTHPTFAGRIVHYYDYGNDGEQDEDGHGTHVAGTALGDGSWRDTDIGQDGKYAGLAPDATLVVQEVFRATTPNANLMGRDAEVEGADVSSNSWISGYFGDYNGQCEAYDRLTLDANSLKAGDQPIFYVFGAGNDGSAPGTIRPPSLAKNVLSVGSTGNDKWGASSDLVSGFSSRGPTEDGRIKPDVLMPGHIVASARSSYPGANSGYPRPPDGQDSYAYGTGTSMSTPGASGASAVVIQYMNDVHGTNPSPAMTKAVLINGAQPLDGYVYPGFDQGWGRIDLEMSLLESDDYMIFRDDEQVELSMEAGSDEAVYWFMVSSDQPLKATLVWSDVPGQVSSSKHLINDLDMVVTDPDGNVYSGNDFENGLSQANASGNPDRTNNVEGFLLANPKAGQWKIQVRAFNIPTGTQDFALVVSGNAVKGHVDLAPLNLAADRTDAEEGSLVGLSATVRNTGNRNGANVEYRLERVDPTLRTEVLDSGSLGDMMAGTARFLAWNVTGVRGDHVFRLVVDPGGTVIESDEDNNALELRFFFKAYDVGLSAPAANRRGDPNHLLLFNLTLTNLGNIGDEIQLDLTEPPPRWLAQLTSDSYTLGPGGSATVRLEVLIPANATADERADITVTATSSGNRTKTKDLDIHVDVNQVFDLEVAAISGKQSMLPGNENELDIMVRNTGNGLDVYTLSLPEPVQAGWWVQLPEPTAEVPLRSEVTLKVLLIAPDPALAGTSVSFTVSVTSSHPILTKSVSFSAEVVQFYDTNVTVRSMVTDGKVGETIRIPLQITNRGNGPVSYSGDINFPDAAWTGGIDLANTTVGGYSDVLANLTFVVPPLAIARSYDFTMVILSSGSEQIFNNFTFRVEQFHDVRISVLPGVPTVTQGQRATLKVLLENEGNGDDTVMLTSSPPSTWTFDFEMRETTLEPYSSVQLGVWFNTEVTTAGKLYEVPVIAYYGPAKTLAVETLAKVNVLVRPDLAIVDGSLNVSEPNPSVDMLVRITVSVANEGETVATDVFVQLFVDDVPVDQPKYMSTIEPGDEESFTMLWRTETGGLRNLRVVADYSNGIDEADEGNNDASVTVDVQPLVLKTSPGPTYLMALAAIAGATTVAMAGRRRRRQRA